MLAEEMNYTVGKRYRLFYDTELRLQKGDVLRRPDGACFVVHYAGCKAEEGFMRTYEMRVQMVSQPPKGSVIHPFFWYPVGR